MLVRVRGDGFIVLLGNFEIQISIITWGINEEKMVTASLIGRSQNTAKARGKEDLKKAFPN